MFRLLLFMVLTVCSLRAGETLRLLSYNIHHGEGMDNKLDLARVAGFIKQQKPDIVFLQEVDKNCTRTKNVDQAAELGKLTEMKPVFAKFMNFQGGEYGMAILTKLPVVSSRTVALPAGTEPRSSAVVTVQTAGGPLTVANVHFYETEAQRFAQAKALVSALGDDKAPAILCGDFNSEPDDAVMKWLAALFQMPKKQGPLQATWPSDKPVNHIDHVLFRPAGAWIVKEYRVMEEKIISDHRPVICVLERP